MDKLQPSDRKIQTKISNPKEWDSWPKLDPNKKWDRDQLWGGPDESEWY